jgi:hypothetical protein
MKTSTTRAGAKPAVSEAQRAAIIVALQSVSDWPALIAKRQRVAKRIKPYLTAEASHQLYLAWLAYSTAAGMNVSQSLLIRRAIELLALRAAEIARDEGARAAEAELIRSARECPEDAR